MPLSNTQADSSGTDRWQRLDMQGRTHVEVGAWTPSLQSEVTINDNDKEFAVPAATQWEVMTLHIDYTSTATAGNRQIVVEIRDGADNIIWEWRAGAVQAASLQRFYSLCQGAIEVAAFRDTDYMAGFLPPDLHLPATYDVHIWDNNNVDGNDDMLLYMLVMSRTTPTYA